MKRLLLCPLLLGAILSTNILFSQENDNSFSKKELVEKRTQNAKHFELKNGKITAEISTGDVHYKDNNGKWEDINSEIIPSNNPEYNFENSTNNLKSYYSNNGVLIKTEAGSIKIGVNPSLVLINANGDEKTIETQSLSESTINGSTVVYNNAFLSGDIEYIVENGKIKNNLILKTLPTQLANESGYLGFSENIELPKGWLIINNDRKAENSSQTKGPLLIKNENGNNVIVIPAPVVFDAKDENLSGLSSAEGIAYKIIKNEIGYQLITMVPLSWLKNADRVFPITIDPTVTLPGSLGGWHNDAPAFLNSNTFVFAGLISSPGPNYKGWIQFNISSIPIGATIGSVETELFVNGSGGPSAQLININDVTGAKGDYPVYNAAAYTDFGNGLYTSFIATGAATYGYYNLGPTAITNLVTDIPSGTFQYALEMDVPSTNWKRFTASLCNLRVTYTTCSPGTGTLDSTICSGGSFVFNGNTYSAANSPGTAILAGAAANGCDSIITITVTELPAVTGVLDSTICSGGSFVFNGTTYSAVNSPGTEMLTTSNGCDSVVTVTVTEMPAITGTLDSTICSGDSFVFNGTTYSAANSTGTETLTAANGCDSVITVTVTELSAIDTSITNSNNTITSNATAGSSYEWIDCGTGLPVIPTVTSQSFTATTNGDYAVIVTVGNCSDTSACVNIATVGINENNFGTFTTLYPNPTTGEINLDLGQNINNGSVTISDVTGKQVYRLENLNKSLLNLDVKHFSKGVYFVKIQSNNQQEVIKLIKQ